MHPPRLAIAPRAFIWLVCALLACAGRAGGAGHTATERGLDYGNGAIIVTMRSR